MIDSPSFGKPKWARTDKKSELYHFRFWPVNEAGVIAEESGEFPMNENDGRSGL